MYKGPHGYSLPAVLVIIAVLGGGLTAYLYQLKSSGDITASTLKRRKAFYVADGVSRAAAELAAEKLRELPGSPAVGETEADFLAAQQTTVQTYLNSISAGLTPSGFQVTELAVSELGTRDRSDIPNGPFEGMMSEMQPFTITTEVRHDDVNTGAVASVRTSVTRANVSMFQFFGFVDGYAYLVNGPGGKFAGRVHTNGNVCAGANGNLYLENLTSAAQFYLQGGAGCRGEHSGGSSWRNLYMPSAPFTEGINTYSISGWTGLFTKVNTHHSSSGWTAAALAGWGGQLQDIDHGVPVVRPPISGDPLVQRGRAANHDSIDNTATSRFLVDPVLAIEAEDVRAQKMAHKADIRIVNGVWYKRIPGFPERIGTPIWSDHPGHYTPRTTETWVSGANDAGQADLFGTGARPRRFSYYRTSNTTPNQITGSYFSAATAITDERPVVSYGPLFRMTTSGVPYWVPGYYPGAVSGGCDPPTSVGDTSGSVCWELKQATTPGQLLQGTRSGFRDPWMETAFSANATDCSADRWSTTGVALNDSYQSALFNMLPMNFDVAAFQAALADLSSGELGHHFISEPFNGVVWIGATWPGSDAGYGADFASSAHATYWPYQGVQDDPHTTDGTNPDVQPNDQSAEWGAAVGDLTSDRYNGYASLATDALPVEQALSSARPPFQRALPLALCSDDQQNRVATAFVYGNQSGTNEDDFDPSTGTTDPRNFYVPDCDHYFETTAGDPMLRATINSVRIINARTLSSAILPEGISIVTNLPMYVVGDLNTSSTPAEKPGDYQAGWVPMMVGGDTVSILSNAWRDDEAPWNVPARTYYGFRNPSDTSYHAAFLYGWNESMDGCRDEFTYSLRIHERWDQGGTTARRIRGSMFIGFSSVYGTAFSNVHHTNDGGSWHDGNTDYKFYGFDYHLELPENQPPGAPEFQVTAVSRFLGP